MSRNTWGTACTAALLAFEARGFSFDPVTVAQHSPDPPHVFEAPRGVPACTPAEADMFLDDPQGYEVVRGSEGAIKVEVLCRGGKFVGVVNRVSMISTADYLCIQRAAGDVHARIMIGGRIFELRDRKQGGIRYFEQVEGKYVVAYSVLWEREDARLRRAQQECALEKAKLYLE